MEFSPFNPIVQRCLQGMEMEEKGKKEEALQLFLQAWEEATNDFEKFLAAHYIARNQTTVANRLKWLETALECALKTNDEGVKSAFARLHANIAQCYTQLGNSAKAKEHHNQALLFKEIPSDKGPFFHGTRADLKAGDLLTPGGHSNYKDGLVMHHIYFTAMVNGAGLAAAMAKGEGRERVYIVEPTGSFEHDPNVTDQKFPGNPTRSYRSAAPLKIVDEATNWALPAPEQLQQFKNKLKNNEGEIIN